MGEFRKFVALPGRLVRAARLLREFARYAGAEAPGRIEPLEQIREWVRERETKAFAEQPLESAKGFAGSLLIQCPWIQAHLALTPHLGCLQPLSTNQLTRLHYVGLQLRLLLGFKQANPGLGLSNHGISASSRPKLLFGGKPISNLEIAQAWAILFNVGHLFGTFGTERGLVYHLSTDDSEKASFIDAIPEGLRERVQAILDAESMYSFVHALTALRLARQSHIPDEVRSLALRLLALYLNREDAGAAVVRLRTMFDKIRQLSYLLLHESLGVEGIRSRIFAAESIQQLVIDDGILFEPFAQRNTPFGKLMDAVDKYHYETFFTGDQAGPLVLKHLRELRTWWERHRSGGVTVPLRIERLFSIPDDWPREEGRRHTEQRLVVKLDVPIVGSKWVGEIKEWRADGSAWKDSSFFLTMQPKATTATCSVYASEDVIGKGIAHHVARNLIRLSRASWAGYFGEEEAQALWRSVARFGRALFQQCLMDRFYLQLRPTKATNSSIGYAAISDDRDALLERLDQFVERCEVPLKKDELVKTREYIDQLRWAENCCCLVFLARTTVVSKATQHEFQEIDGIVAEILPAEVRWHALEVKEAHLKGAKAQLENLGKALLCPVTEPDQVECGPYRLRRCQWIGR